MNFSELLFYTQYTHSGRTYVPVPADSSLHQHAGHVCRIALQCNIRDTMNSDIYTYKHQGRIMTSVGWGRE